MRSLRINLFVLFLMMLLVPAQLHASSARANAETIEGEWTGGTDAPGKWISIQVRFTKLQSATESALAGSLDGFEEISLGFDTPAVRNVSLKNLRVDLPSIRFEIPSPAGVFSFEGTLKDGVINGTATSGSRRAALHLVRVAPLNPQLYSRYVGTYKGGTKTFAITWREFGGLRMIDLRSGMAQSLVPVSTDTFYIQKSILTSSASPQRVAFVTNGEGQVLGFQRPEGGGTELSVRTNSFSQQQVSFKNGDTTLSGALLLPSGKGPHPAVVLVHGYGPIYGTALFERAATFTRMGVAALIYDKRGTGNSNGSWQMSETTFEDLADDALAAVRYLKERKEINHKQIGLQGHSQAGDVIPIAAAKSKDVAFVIIASGGGVKMEESVLYEKRNDLIAARRFSTEEIEAATTLLRRVHDFVIRGIGDKTRLETDYLEAQKQRWFRLTDLPPFRTLPSPDSKAMVYARKEIGFDPAPYAEKLTIPVLVLLGESDKAVPPDKASAGWLASLQKAGNKRFKIEIIKGADHGLRVPDEKGTKTVAPDYWGVMSTWLFIQLDGVKS